jgi:hypothetical protein
MIRIIFLSLFLLSLLYISIISFHSCIIHWCHYTPNYDPVYIEGKIYFVDVSGTLYIIDQQGKVDKIKLVKDGEKVEEWGILYRPIVPCGDRIFINIKEQSIISLNYQGELTEYRVEEAKFSPYYFLYCTTQGLFMINQDIIIPPDNIITRIFDISDLLSPNREIKTKLLGEFDKVCEPLRIRNYFPSPSSNIWLICRDKNYKVFGFDPQTSNFVSEFAGWYSTLIYDSIIIRDEGFWSEGKYKGKYIYVIAARDMNENLLWKKDLDDWGKTFVIDRAIVITVDEIKEHRRQIKTILEKYIFLSPYTGEVLLEKNIRFEVPGYIIGEEITPEWELYIIWINEEKAKKEILLLDLKNGEIKWKVDLDFAPPTCVKE